LRSINRGDDRAVNARFSAGCCCAFLVPATTRAATCTRLPSVFSLSQEQAPQHRAGSGRWRERAFSGDGGGSNIARWRISTIRQAATSTCLKWRE
jgi:hypothetical protein